MRQNLILIILFGVFNIQAQSTKLSSNFGFDFAKLGENIDSVKNNIEFYPYTCNYCNATDSIAKKYDVKSRDKLVINGVSTDRQNTFYFVENKLYKMDLTFSNNEIFQNKLYEYFVSVFGKETKINGSYRIWDTKDAYLSMYHPTFKKDNKSTHYSSFELFSKDLDNLRRQKIEDLTNNNQSVAVEFKEDRKAKGNGTFVPDFDNSFKLLQNKITRKNFEQILPNFKVKDSISSSYSYNEKTNIKDVFNGIVSQYTFRYKDEYMVYVDVTSKNDIINRLEFYFDSKQDLNKLKSQVIKNGFQYDERLTKVLIKLGYKFCLAYTKKPSYNFTYYNEKKFTISIN